MVLKDVSIAVKKLIDQGYFSEAINLNQMRQKIALNNRSESKSNANYFRYLLYCHDGYMKKDELSKLNSD